MKKLILLLPIFFLNVITLWAQFPPPPSGPIADFLEVTGTLEVGETLTGSYDYVDPNELPEDGTTYQWYRLDSEFEPPVLIDGATAQTYTLVSADEGKLIVFEVTPSNGTETGMPTPSNPVGPIGGSGSGSGGGGGNNPPTVSNVSISGTLEVGETLTGSYDYDDLDSDPESGSVLTWYRSDDSGGTNKTAIGGADATTYTLVSADEGKYMSFSVIPSDGVDAGISGESSLVGPVQGESVSVSFAGGTGIEADPYQVETLEQLQALKDSPSSHFVLNNDLDASATSTWNSGAGFVPIGGNTPFTGSFDGQGFVITGLTIDRTTEDYVGLFAVIGDGGTVSNIGLEQLSISGGGNTGGLAGENNGTISGSYADGDVDGSAVVGGLVGLNNSNISESYSAGTVAGTQDIGGLVGLHSLGTITKSYSTSDATGTANNVGGLIGFSYDNVENSYATGSVSGDTNVGGFAGNYNSGTVSNSYSTGAVTGSSNVGGFIGQKYISAAATNSFWDTQSSGQAAATGTGSTTGITGKTTTEMQTQSTFTDAGWDFTDIWAMSGYPSLKAFVGNTAPVVTNAVADFSVYEDSSVDPINFTDVFSDNEDNDADLTYSLVSNTNTSLVFTSVDNTQDILGFLLQSNANGSTDITIQAEDSEGLTVQHSFTLTVNPVNDGPVFTLAGNQSSNEDAGDQTVENFLTVSSKGAADESDQALSLTVESDNEALFLTQPSIDLNTGTLNYTASSDSSGTATVTVTLSDDGGTGNGGSDQTVKTFVITVNPVNDAPYAEITYGNPVVLNTSGLFSQALFIAYFEPGPSNESGQKPLEYAVSTEDSSLFEVQPEIVIAGTGYSGGYEYAGTLTFTPLPDTTGVAVVSVKVIDDGGTDNGGEDSYEIGFTITINQGNRAPLASNAGITGYPKTGETIAATYDFEDADGDANAGASFQWYRKVYGEYGSSSEAKIDGATDSLYIITSTDNFNDLRVEVVPFDGTAYGDTITSGYVKANPFEGGSGTEADPYLISMADQLNAMRDVYSEQPNNLDGHFKLINDINLDVAPYNEGEGWIPITRGESVWFLGSLDGDNHTITGLYINSTAQQEYVGLIGGHSGTVRNLKLEEVNLRGTTNYNYVGPIGYVSGGTVSNVHVTGTVSGPTAGGIAGALWNDGSITESSFDGTVTGTVVGGIAGDIETDGVDNTFISKSYSTGSVSGERAGGIVGSVTDGGTISDSYSLATVSGSTFEGGIVSFNGATQTHNYFAGTLSDVESNTYWNTSGEQTTDVSTGAMKDSLTFADAGFDFANTWAIVTGDSISYPYLQNNPQIPIPGKELGNTTPIAANAAIAGTPKVGEVLAATYDFTDADGDANAGASFQWYRANDNAGTNEVEIMGATDSTYTPIPSDNFKYLRLDVTPSDGIESGEKVSSGYVLVSPFEGGSGTEADPFLITTAAQLDSIRTNIDDLGYITGHYKLNNDIDLNVAPYNQGNGWIPFKGSFGDGDFDGTFDGDNHTISGLYINSSDFELIGLFGFISGTIRNLKLTDVNITSGSVYVGSLGYAGSVSNVHVTGTVRGGSSMTGGLISRGANITNSSFMGTVTGTRVGGIVGEIPGGTISSNYTSGTVSGTEKAGGLVGVISDPASINTSYSLATVTGSSLEGGIFGEAQGSATSVSQNSNYYAGVLGGTATNAIWDNTGTELTGITATQIKDSLTFANAGFDFENTWAIVTGDSVSYPYLQANPQSPIPGKVKANSAPVVSTPIADVTVDENAANTVIDLSANFSDEETASGSLIYSVEANDNPTMLTATITNSVLSLDYQTNQFGTANITVQASDGDLSVEDTFVVIVKELLDLKLAATEPMSSAPGTQISLHGSGFEPTAAANTVTFTKFGQTEGTPATVDSVRSSTGMRVNVPEGLEGGQYKISVQRSSDGAVDTLVSLFAVITGNENAKFVSIGAGIQSVQNGSSEWGDYDGDGDLDVVVTGSRDGSGGSTFTGLYRNDGGEFNIVSNLSSGVRNGSSSWGDYDGDGDLDLVITGWDGFEPRAVLYRNDEGTFSEVSAGLTGVYHSTSDWVDYDGDGDLDLFIAGDRYAGAPELTLLYENDGGVFTEVPTGIPGVYYSTSDWGDYDGDGDLDLVLTGSGGHGLYRNDEGAFTRVSADLATDVNSNAQLGGAGSSAWGDYDGDGDLDLMITGISGSGAVSKLYRNDGGAFAEVSAGFSGVNHGTSDWGDYDGDGDLDVLITGDGGHGLYRNDDGAFTEVTSGLNTGVEFSSSAWGDYDGDGDLDLIITGGWNQTATIYENREFVPNLSLTATEPMSSAPGTQISLHGSGFEPTAAANTVTFTKFGQTEGTPATVDSVRSSTGMRVNVPEGLEGGQYKISVQRSSDGAVDTLVSLFAVITGNENAKFVSIGAGIQSVQNGSSEWGDYDGDGDLDVVVTGSRDGSGGSTFTGLYRNDGGEFNIVSNLSSGVRNGSSSWGDYDGDGDLDLVITGWDGFEPRAVLYRNDEGTFSEVSAGLTGVYHSTSDWVDYDGDGDLDLFIAGDRYAGAPELTLLYENDGGVFTEVPTGIPGVYYSTSDWGDYDGDGDLDLVLTGSGGHGLYRNDEGAFTRVSADLATDVNSNAQLGGAGSSAWGDYDGDGDLDLMITGISGSGAVSKLYRNDGGAFAEVSAGFSGVNHGTSDWGDYDGDGDLDVLITGDGGHGLYRNDDGAFTEVTSGLNTGVEFSSSAWGDYDGDGDLDLIITGGRNQTATIYENTGFDPLVATTLISPADEATGVALKPTFKWNALQGVTGYDLMGSLNENFSDSMVVKGIADTTFILYTVLEMGVNFHWRVRGITDSDSTAWSEPFSFTTTQPNELFTTVDKVTLDDGGAETNVCPDGVDVGEEIIVWITITDDNGKVYTDADSEILQAYIPGANIGAGADVSFVYDNESELWKASFPLTVLGNIEYVVAIPSISNLRTNATFEACLTTFVVDGIPGGGLFKSAKTKTSDSGSEIQADQEPFVLGLEHYRKAENGELVRDTLRVFVDWGDGNTESFKGMGYPSHTYTTAENVEIKVAGNQNSFKASVSKKQASFFKSIKDWGETEWLDLSNAFEGATNLNIQTEDAPDLTNVTSLEGMFKGAKSFNAPVGEWDVSNVKNMASMFQGAESFNQDISSWDISNVQYFDTAPSASAKQTTIEKVASDSEEAPISDTASGKEDKPAVTDTELGIATDRSISNGGDQDSRPISSQKESPSSQQNLMEAQTESITGFLVGSGISSANASKMFVGWKDKINTTVQSINIGNIELDALGAAALKEVQQATGVKISWGGQQGVDDEPVFSGLPNPFELATEDTRILKLWEYVSDANTPDSQLEFKFDIISDSVEIVAYNTVNGELSITARADADTFFVAIQASNTDGITSLDTLEVRTDPNFTTSSELMAALPQQAELQQNYPNPFNPTTVIRYGVPQSSEVRLEVFDMLGRKVATLVNNEKQRAGWHQVNFDASRLASGMYLYRIVAGQHVQTRKMLLIK